MWAVGLNLIGADEPEPVAPSPTASPPATPRPALVGAEDQERWAEAVAQLETGAPTPEPPEPPCIQRVWPRWLNRPVPLAS